MSDHGHTRPKRPGGRRALFVDPPSVVQEQMVHFLVAAQFEAAIVKDHRAIDAVLEKFPNSIVYFNADSRHPKGALEQIVRAVISGKERHGADVGMLSYNEDQELARLYLMEIGVSCGFVTLNIGFEKSARTIIRALQAAEATGDRRFVRVRVPVGKAGMNISVSGNERSVSGRVLDMSEAGTACVLDTAYPPGTIFEDIQLQLWGSLCKVSGRIAGKRETPEGTVSVIMFDPIGEASVRSKIYAFLKRVMQHEIDSVL